MYSKMTIANNTVLCTWKLLREWILNILTTHTHTHTETVWGDGY